MSHRVSFQQKNVLEMVDFVYKVVFLGGSPLLFKKHKGVSNP